MGEPVDNNREPTAQRDKGLLIMAASTACPRESGFSFLRFEDYDGALEIIMLIGDERMFAAEGLTSSLNGT